MSARRTSSEGSCKRRTSPCPQTQSFGVREAPVTDFSSDRGGISPALRSPVVFPVEATTSSYSLSTGAYMLLAFCLLNAALGFLFSYLFSSKSVTFQLTSIHHNWDEKQKAKSCLNAGIGYLVVALLVAAGPLITRLLNASGVMRWTHKAKHEVRNKCRRFVPKEKLSLLGYSRKKGSDESDSQSESEMDERKLVTGGGNTTTFV